MLLIGKPSISMGHIYHGKLLVITRWYIPLNPIKPPFSYGFPIVFLCFSMYHWESAESQKTEVLHHFQVPPIRHLFWARGPISILDDTHDGKIDLFLGRCCCRTSATSTDEIFNCSMVEFPMRIAVEYAGI